MRKKHLHLILSVVLALLQVSPALALGFGDGLGFRVKPAPRNAPYLLTSPDSRLPEAEVFDPSDFLTAPIDLETEVTGALPLANGGLGASAATVAARAMFGNHTGSTAAPSFSALTASDLPNTAVTPGSYTSANITVDAQGRLTAASNGGSVSNQQKRWTKSAVLTGTAAGSYSSLGLGTISVTSTGVAAAALLDTTGQYVTCTSTTSSNNTAGWTSAATTVIQTRVQPIFKTHIKTGSAITNCRIWSGFASDTSATQTSDDPTGTNMAAFRYATGTDGTAFWRCYVNDGSGGGTATTTTTAIATDTDYALTIDATNPASILFYINDVLVATCASDLPSTSANLRLLTTISNTASAQRVINTGGISLDALQ